MSDLEAQDDTANGGQGLLRVRRGSDYQDRLRAYKVRVDGVEAGTVRCNSTVEIALQPGTHKVAVAIDWCGSNQLEITASEGETVELECGSSLTGWRIILAIFYAIFLHNEYLWLGEVGKTEAPG